MKILRGKHVSCLEIVTHDYEYKCESMKSRGISIGGKKGVVSNTMHCENNVANNESTISRHCRFFLDCAHYTRVSEQIRGSELEFSDGILRKRVNDEFFRRVTVQMEKIVGEGGSRRDRRGDLFQSIIPSSNTRVGFIQPPLSGESQLCNPWKKRPPSRFRIASVNLLCFGAFERKSARARKSEKGPLDKARRPQARMRGREDGVGGEEGEGQRREKAVRPHVLAASLNKSGDPGWRLNSSTSTRLPDTRTAVYTRPAVDFRKRSSVIPLFVTASILRNPLSWR